MLFRQQVKRMVKNNLLLCGNRTMEKLGLQKTEYMEGVCKNFAPPPTPVPI